MVTSRDRVIKTLNQELVDRVPRDLWASPGIQELHGDELAEMTFRYPTDIEQPDFRYPRGDRASGSPYEVGQHSDAWECTWKVERRDAPGRPGPPPLADLARLDGYRPPCELLQKAKLGPVNRACAASSRFVLAWSETRPFERLQLLRGSEAALADLASGTKPIGDLLAMLHDFSCREMELWASSDVDGVAFMDDWGSQVALLLPTKTWRDLFKPLYREYCRILHDKDKFAFFRSDGNISAIFRDLVEIGVDAIHCRLFSMNLESLAERFRGRVTFWGEIDREQVLRLGAPDDVGAAVRRVRRALDFGSGGLIAQCEWGLDVPFQNVAAMFEHWLEPVPAHV